MSFDADYLLTTTLIKVQLPTQTLRICDGGFVVWATEPDGQGGTSPQTYISDHPDYGTLYAGGAISDGEGDSAPAAGITFLTDENASAETLTSPAMQWSPVAIWQASVNGQTGTVLAVVPLFFGFVNIPTLRDGSNGRLIDMTLVADTERFFITNEGNRLSQENHQSRYPGENGLNNMTGVETDVAWGTQARPRTTNGGAAATSGATSTVRDAVQRFLG